MGKAAVDGAAYNVLVNLGSLKDEQFVAKLTAEVVDIKKDAKAIADEIATLVEEKIQACLTT